RRSLVSIVLIAVCLSIVPVWAVADESAGKLGVGGSFNLALGSPVFDLFYEIPTGRNAATRFTLGIWAVVAGGMAFSVDASFLITPAIEGFQPYFGGGVGGLAVAAGGIGGVAQINLTVNGMAGAYIPLSDTFGLYGQVRLIGLIDLATLGITALLMPGIGLYVMFEINALPCSDEGRPRACPLFWAWRPLSTGAASFRRFKKAPMLAAVEARAQMKAVVGPLVLLGLLLGFSVLLFWTTPAPPEVGDYQRLWQARDRLPATLRELESLAAREDGLGWQARVIVGRWHASHGSPGTAVTHFRAALALYAASNLRVELALALEASGRGAEALQEWERLLPRKEAIQAVVRLEADPVRAASTLNKGGVPSEALTLLSKASSTQATLERARALVSLGRTKDALPEFERYLAAAPQDTPARLEYGRALERTGEWDKALAAYRAAGTSGAYEAGLLLETLGREDEAIAAYRQSAEPEAKWRAARLLDDRGRIAEALTLYWELARGSHRVRDDAALRTHLLHAQRGESAKAAEAARLLSPAFAWLLGIPHPPPTRVADPAPASSPAVAVANALLQEFPHGDGRRWAEVELGIASTRGSVAERLAVGEWHASQDDWRNAFRIGSSVLSALACPRAYRLAYPLAWWDAVIRWSSAYGVDPYLVLAVMREESGFSSTAVSSSDARGLMQLLPSTARWIAEEKLKVPYREADLARPEVNIQLGTWYLGYLLREFAGDTAKAVAAYNGGPGNLQRWTAGGIASPGDLPALLRFTETREYLAKVLNSWLVYRWLYQG
ncbi:MAG: transglycosylase SLT domain-containing protein, partial [Candidatus Bipolaricaulota bacterium]